jgi:hypothetical protein
MENEEKPKNKKQARDNKMVAYNLYVEIGKSQTDICELLHIHGSQMSKWVKDGNWKELREAQLVTVHSLKANNLQLIADIQKTIKTEQRTVNSKEADIIFKLSATNEKLEKRADLSDKVFAISEFLDFTKGNIAEELFKLICENARDYLETEANKQGKYKNTI